MQIRGRKATTTTVQKILSGTPQDEIKSFVDWRPKESLVGTRAMREQHCEIELGVCRKRAACTPYTTLALSLPSTWITERRKGVSMPSRIAFPFRRAGLDNRVRLSLLMRHRTRISNVLGGNSSVGQQVHLPGRFRLSHHLQNPIPESPLSTYPIVS
jgi:hypothetical protein